MELLLFPFQFSTSSPSWFYIAKWRGLGGVPLSILNILPHLILHSQMEGARWGSLSIPNICPLLILHSQNGGDWVGLPFNSQHLPPPDFTQPKWRGGASPFQTLQFSLLHNQMATFLWPTNGFWYYSFCGLFFSSSSSDVKYVLLTWTSVHKFLYNHTAHSILFMWHAKDCTSCARLLSSHSLLCSNSVFPRYNFGMTSD